MAAETPVDPPAKVSFCEEVSPPPDPLDATLRPLDDSSEENDDNTTIHGFNLSNVTVIERLPAERSKTTPQCEGSDSGVEVVESLLAQSCNSSVISSCCSNYDEAYNLLVRKNSTLLEDYRRHGDATSENGSESSSVSGSRSRTRRTSGSGGKKRPANLEARAKPAAKERSRSKPPVNPKSTRLKSVDRSQPQAKPPPPKSKIPGSLEVGVARKSGAATGARPPPTPRPAAGTPSDDGRWPSVNGRPAPVLMSRSLRGPIDSPRPKMSQQDARAIEKYATLPRQKKEKSRSTENTLHRTAPTKKTSNATPSKPITAPKPRPKTRIFHESSAQTVLTMRDVENALSGATVAPRQPRDSERRDAGAQAQLDDPECGRLQRTLGRLGEKFEALRRLHDEQAEVLRKTEAKLRDEAIEKEGLRRELERNSKRVLAILGDAENSDPNASSDSLLVLESKFQNVGQVVVQQEEEISKLNTLCRALQIDLEKNLTEKRILLQQHRDLELESVELQDFMQAEKTTLHDALKETEMEIQRQRTLMQQKDKDLAEQQEEYRTLLRLSEQRRQENISLQSRLAALESKSRELLVQQGSTVSGAAVALSSLIGRIDGLVEELVVAYNISEQELEDVIFHNEAYKNSSSSPESTPEKSKQIFTSSSPSPQKGSSFVSAVINAIKSAAQSPFALRDLSRDNLSIDHSSSNEMLDSETEPCLMMEHVLEDVLIPDGHSHNLVSSGHGSVLSSRLTRGGSLGELSRCPIGRQLSEPCSLSLAGSFSECLPAASLVDQVIEVDNLVTRLLKVIRIVQLENEDCMGELQEQRNGLAEQVDRQKETNKVVVKQLKDWEVLGARLKTEVKDLLAQTSRKNMEIDGLRTELNKQREEVEKLNQDVCELSTALSKAELEHRMKEDEVAEEVKKWEETGETPPPEMLGRLISSHNEMSILKQKLSDKEKHLTELTHEFLASRQVLSESLKDAVNESKKQYEAIDKALEVFHSIQPVVQQCGPLAKLQRDLEETNFKSASTMPLITPPDFNANAALVQAVASLESAPTINSTA